MPAIQYAGWCDHLSRYPAGNRHTHYLLARICSILYNSTLEPGQDAKGPEHFAPWLSDPKPATRPVREKDSQAERIRRLSAVAHGALNF